MSRCRDLDKGARYLQIESLIIECLRSRPMKFCEFYNLLAPRADGISGQRGTMEAYHVIGNRLQLLRKEGYIAYNPSTRCWRLVRDKGKA